MNGKEEIHRNCKRYYVPFATCKNMCDSDKNCKGFNTENSDSGCQIATNSSCPPGWYIDEFSSDFSKGNVGHIVEDSILDASRSQKPSGCFIKESRNDQNLKKLCVFLLI